MGADLKLVAFAGLLFVIASSPVVYKLTDKAAASTVKIKLADANGNPTKSGTVVHAVVVALATYAYLRSS